MRVGCSRWDITPEVGCDLSGYVARTQPSIGVHTPLYARALFCSDDNNAFVWIHTETIGFHKDDADRLRQRIGAVLGLPSDNTILTATHTHAGPGTLRLLNCGAYDGRYMDMLANELPEMALAAREDAEDVEAWSGEGFCDLNRDRRAQPSAHTDPRVGLIGWRRNDGTWKAVLVNYPIHNVALGGENRFISSDLFGQTATRLSEKLPGAPEALVTNGACGNLNPPTHTTTFGQVETWGDTLAESVRVALVDAKRLDRPALMVKSGTLDVPIDVDGPTSIRHWADELIASVGDAKGYVAERIRDAAEQWRANQLRAWDAGEIRNTVPLPVQAIYVGPVILVGVGAEAFSRLADDLRQATGREVYAVGYANGNIGYLAPEASYDEGGYEIEGAFIFYNAFRPERGAFESVCEQLAEWISR